MNAHSGTGNGLLAASAGNREDMHALADHGRQIQHDAEALAAHVRDAGSSLQGFLTEQVEQRPLTTLGVAAGLGYLLGGGLSSKLTVLMFGVATRIGAAVIAREVAAQISQSDWSGNPNRSPETSPGTIKERS
ncbi:MAG: hypothetical protein SH850_04980 [Planctomycetaceae bacterium]|nr:hypothetical protein [Planctomycetaceae bacterium]